MFWDLHHSYIRDNIPFELWVDIAIFNEGELESIFIETTDTSVIIGEIYRVPNTSVQLSLERYEQMSKLAWTKLAIIGTDKIFDLFEN